MPEISGIAHDVSVSVVDNTAWYIEMMQDLFNFDQIKQMITSRPADDFKLLFDGMHGVSGPYAEKIFGQIIAGETEGKVQLLRCEVLPDFGGAHPDPNLTYAKDLVTKMGIQTEEEPEDFAFGAACDGDADRNMILGNKFFVTPSDSLAVIVANHKLIPYFEKGIKGVARSMPTSGAVDQVAKKMKIPCYETPTGWKFFGNLLDSSKIDICGEESFGTGSSHVREKDGIWAVLCWLQIIAAKNKDPTAPLVTVKDIVESHWQEYGRNYYRRYDYEDLDSEAAAKVFDQIQS